MVNALDINSIETLKTLATVSKPQARSVANGYMKALQKQGGDTGVLVNRNPFDTIYIGEILRIFPRAKILLAMRDPADVVLSCYMQMFTINDANSTLTTPLGAAKTYDCAMKLWVQYNELFDLDSIICRYEDLVDNPEGTLRPIIDFLGIEWDENTLNHEKTAASRERINTVSYAQVVQPVYSSSVRRWESYAEFMPEALEILAPWRAYFGYGE